jgi:transposase
VKKRQSYSPEFKEEAVKSVIETSRPIAQVAKQLGVVEQTLGNWVAVYRRDHAGDEPALSVPERARLREQEREIRELKIENDFLKKAAAYFAKDPR